MDVKKIKLIAFDLDGTLTQHRTKLGDENRAVLDRLSRQYKLLMVGAGMCSRIFEQMNKYPIDIIGNYGMQYAVFNKDSGELDIAENNCIPCDRQSVDTRITALRNKYGFTEFAGDNVEFHASGCVTFPILGTKADIADKLAFDPDRAKRRAIYDDVKNIFSDFTVFIGGSSSFDMAPAPYDKAYALHKYCNEHGLLPGEVAYIGDDYGSGGNDESVYLSDINFIKIDDYRELPELVNKFSVYNQ